MYLCRIGDYAAGKKKGKWTGKAGEHERGKRKGRRRKMSAECVLYSAGIVTRTPWTDLFAVFNFVKFFP